MRDRTRWRRTYTILAAITCLLVVLLAVLLFSQPTKQFAPDDPTPTTVYFDPSVLTDTLKLERRVSAAESGASPVDDALIKDMGELIYTLESYHEDVRFSRTMDAAGEAYREDVLAITEETASYYRLKRNQLVGKTDEVPKHRPDYAVRRAKVEATARHMRHDADWKR